MSRWRSIWLVARREIIERGRSRGFIFSVLFTTAIVIGSFALTAFLRGGDAPDGRKVKATLHWVSAAHAVDAEVRLYDRLFGVEIPGTEYGESHGEFRAITEQDVVTQERIVGRIVDRGRSGGTALESLDPNLTREKGTD